MVTQNVCPTCGTELAPNAPAGLCVKCVFAEMLAPEPAAEAGELAPFGPPPSPGALPRWFCGYELLEEIARGGMGIVYRARQAQLKRIVALKVILAGDSAAPEFIRRFRTEAEAAASLDHPNIVPIFEFGEFAGQPFFSMKLIDGHPLGRRITAFQSPAGIRAAAVLVAKLAGAVHYAHTRGVLHRDLKPNNVLLDAADEPHLTDFGVAKLIEKDTAVTLVNSVLGTPSYMAPEQARGDAKQVTTAADVYGLGAILYELLTGHPPFSGSTAIETIRLVLEKEPRRPTAENPRLPRDLETICLKCLEKKPLQRYESADALAKDLERWLKGEPIQARPASTLERIIKWARRKPVVALLLSGSLVSLALVGGISSWQSAARQRALVQSRRSLYAAQIGLVQQAWSEGHVVRAHTLLESLKPEPGAEDLRGFEWQYFWRLCRDQSYYTLAEEQIPVQSVAASPDGRLLALTGGFPYVSLWDVASRRVLVRLKGGTGNRSVVFSPDGRLVAAAGYDLMIRVWDVATFREAFSLNSHAHTVERLAFSPDGKWLASASRPDGTVKVWDLATRKERASFGKIANDRPAVAFSPDATLMAWSAGDSTIRLVNVETWQEIATLSGHGWIVDYLAFSHDGLWLASAGADGAAKLWDVPARREVATLSGHKAWVTSVDFSPDDRLLSTTCIDGTIKLWNVRTKAEMTTLKGHEMWVNNAVFLPDGRTLASGGDDRNLKLWNVSPEPRIDGEETVQIPDTPLPVLSGENVGESLEPGLNRDDAAKIFFPADGSSLMAVDNRPIIQVWDGQAKRLSAAFALSDAVAFATLFFPDGTQFATAGRDGKIRLWSLDPPRQNGILSEASCTLSTLAISPDGRQLAGSGQTGKLWLWDIPSRQLIRTLSYGSGVLSALSFYHENRNLIGAVRSLKIPDQLCRIDLAMGAIRMLPQHHLELVTSIVISPDESVVASSSRDATVALWRLPSLEYLGSLRGHSGYVTSAAFSRDSRTLATASNDGTVKLWSVRAQSELVTLPGHIAPGTRLAFSPDGNELAACGDDGRLHIWRSDPVK